NRVAVGTGDDNAAEGVVGNGVAGHGAISSFEVNTGTAVVTNRIVSNGDAAGVTVGKDAVIEVVQGSAGRIDADVVALNDSVGGAVEANAVPNGVPANGVAVAAGDEHAAGAVAVDRVAGHTSVRAEDGDASGAVVGDGVITDGNVARRG